MKKVYIENLCMILTNKCNLNCRHCLRGPKDDTDISKEVIEATLNQIIAIHNLNICGGEVTLALDSLEYIFKYIVDNRILLDLVSITINGTNYSEDFLKLLEYIDSYISDNVIFTISYDKYHLEEIERLGLLDKYIDNIEKYSTSKYYYGLRKLDSNLKLFREGNAEELDQSLTTPLRPIDIVVTYAGEKGIFDKENGLCNIAPLMTVNTEGIITEDNASFNHQSTIYNYGNVFDNSFEEVAIERGKILKPKKYEREKEKIIKRYTTYN